MKKIQVIINILVFPVALFGQKSNNSDPVYLRQIKKNIYRIIYTQPIDKDFETNGIIAFNYERKIINAFSVASKLGVATSVNKFGEGSNPYQISFHLFSSIEARYYFTLHSLMRKGKKCIQFFKPLYIITTKFIF